MGKLRDSVDIRALRFAVGFPLVLAAAFVVCAVLIRPDLPEPLAVRWAGGAAADFAPFGAVVGVGAAMIVLFGGAVLVQAVPLSRPAIMRRIMMGAGLFVSLFVTTVLAAVLVGQLGLADARRRAGGCRRPRHGQRRRPGPGRRDGLRVQSRRTLVHGR